MNKCSRIGTCVLLDGLLWVSNEDGCLPSHTVCCPRKGHLSNVGSRGTTTPSLDSLLHLWTPNLFRKGWCLVIFFFPYHSSDTLKSLNVLVLWFKDHFENVVKFNKSSHMQVQKNIFLRKILKIMYLSLAALGLCCCTGFSQLWQTGASLVMEHGLETLGLSSCGIRA